MGRPEGPYLGRKQSTWSTARTRETTSRTSDGTPSRPEPSGPSTGGVRIIGAETAADITSEVPVVPPAHITPDGTAPPSVRIIESRSTSRSR